MTSEEELGVSPFPHPPKIFYKLYTDENMKNDKVPAPPQPVKGKYSMFGASFDTRDAMIRQLQDQNIKQLYPVNYDCKSELKKLNRSIIVCFLELLDILILNPASPARNQKITDLSYLFINMHHLINEFRPHQARETLKVIMERQKKQREEITSQLLRNMEDAWCILRECGEMVAQAASTVPHSMKIAQSGGRGGEGVATEDKSTKTESKEKLSGVNAESIHSKMESCVGEARKLVEKQDAELCGLIDSLIPNT